MKMVKAQKNVLTLVTLVAGLVSLFATQSLSADETAPEKEIWLDSIDLSRMTSGWNRPKARTAVSGQPLSIGGKKFERGVGTHALSSALFHLKGDFERFEAEVGVDDGFAKDVGQNPRQLKMASVKFLVYLDDPEQAAFVSPVMHYGDAPYRVSVPLKGAKTIELFVCDAMDGSNWDHADWANARFVGVANAQVEPFDEQAEQLGILTPPPRPEPRINGAKIYGVRPGHDILYRLPVTGEEPLSFSVGELPRGVSFNAKRGILTGSIAEAGDYPIVFTARNARGESRATILFRVGEKIALTPPMGWNSWNCFAETVTAEKICTAADIMDRSELAKHGYNYVNIDDAWQNSVIDKKDATVDGPERNADGTIAVNKRFGSMKALADYLHSKGFRAGLYSSPGAYTCGSYTGSWKHEWTDAKSYAEWGFDYLKYDWCGYGEVSFSYGEDATGTHLLPYMLMGEALRAQNRDIVFSLCQYGMHNVSAWGAKTGGNSWRTTGDIIDSWSVVGTEQEKIGYRGVYDIIRFEIALWPFAQPGEWNDPDMLSVGVVGFNNPHATKLTPNEQYTHLTFWSILCSPLLIGCDLTKLDAFTLNLLCNDEVLETNQDPLGAQAAKVALGRKTEVWAKPMSDGSIVFALLNTDRRPRRISVDFPSLGMEGEWRVRDLWRQQDIGLCTKGFSAQILIHASGLYRAFPQVGAGMRKGYDDVRRNWIYHTYERGRQIDKPGFVSPFREHDTACENCPKTSKGH